MDMDYLYGMDEKGNMAYFYETDGVFSIIWYFDRFVNCVEKVQNR